MRYISIEMAIIAMIALMLIVALTEAMLPDRAGVYRGSTQDGPETSAWPGQ